MTLWADRFDAHPLWPAVGEARARVNQLKIDLDDAAQQDALGYVGMTIELLERRRTESEKNEIVPSMLTETNNAVATWSADLQAVIDGSIALAAVVPDTDSVVASLAAWPPLKPAKFLVGAQAASELFVSKVKSLLADVDARTKDSTAKLEILVTAEQELRDALAGEKQTILDAVTNFEIDSQKLVSESISDSLKLLNDTVSVQTAEGAKLIESLRAHEKTAQDSVHATTAWVVATDYGKYARNKTVAAWACDVAAAVVGAAGVATVLYHLLSVGATAAPDVGLSITRFSASLGTLGIAALIGRRGAQHHKEARAAKRTDLALRRVGPFITNLPAEEQQEIILDLTERVFIRGDLDVLTPAESASFRERIAAVRSRRREQAETTGA